MPSAPRLSSWPFLPPLLAGAVIALVLALAGLLRPEAFASLEAIEPSVARALPGQDRIASRFQRPGPAFPAPPPSALPDGPDRDWSRLDPAFHHAVRLLFARMAERGYDLTLLEGYRSPGRQAHLAALDLTPAGPGRSLHQYGLAVDVGLVRDGRRVVSTRDPWAREAYRALGEEAERLGLVWGGRWAAPDLCHVQATLASGLPAPMPPPPPTLFPWERS